MYEKICFYNTNYISNLTDVLCLSIHENFKPGVLNDNT